MLAAASRRSSLAFLATAGLAAAVADANVALQDDLKAAAQGATALIDTTLQASLAAKLQTQWRLIDPSSATAADLSVATVLVPPRSIFLAPGRLDELLAQMPAGRLLQWQFTGTDMLNITAVPSRFIVCDVHQGGTSIPEYVLAAALSWNTQLPQVDAQFRSCTWHGQNRCPHVSKAHRSAKGQTIGLIGYGSIGSGVAVRAVAFGMRVVAVTYPLPSSTPPPLAWIGGDDRLPQLMEESDFVVVACPLNIATRGLVGASALAHMKPEGVLINVARGAVVDESALYHSLSKRSIGGAVLDVWWNDFAWAQPGDKWPSRFNFSSLRNVWMTPHMSCDTEEAAEESLTQMAANFDALATGAPLRNVVRNATPSAFSIQPDGAALIEHSVLL